MRDTLSTLLVAASLFSFVSPTKAGEVDEPASNSKAVLEASEAFAYEGASGWDLEFRPYLWTANLQGVTGVNGMLAPVDLSFSDILDNLDFAYANTLDIRHSDSRFGFFIDFSYISMSPLIDEIPAPLFSTIGIDIEMTLVDAAVTYRLAEWERGYLDLIAGARYTNLDMGLRLAPNPAGISDVSQTLAANASQRIQSTINETVSQKIRAVQGQVKSGIQSKIQDGVAGRIPPQFPDLPDGPIRDRISDLIQAQVAEQLAAAEARAAEAQGMLTAAQSKALEQAQKASSKAERALAKQIESSLNHKLPREVGGSEGWWDPHVGFRAKHYVFEKVYVAGIFDIGGFGVGSDKAIQAGGGFGYQVNDRFALEVLYRYLKTDYRKGGFVYDTEMSGLFLGGAIAFGD